ncbi:hypothetical protein AB4369_27260, partial [Vibrio sp. 10N.261.49.A5]
MSATNQSDLNLSFSHSAEIFGIPSNLRSSMESVIWDNINNKRMAIKKLESKFPYEWTSQVAKDALIARGERFPYLKEQLDFIVGYVIKLAHVNRQFRDADKTKRLLPYLKIMRGSAIIDCPIHSEFIDHVYEVTDKFWIKYPVGKHIDCSCSIRT